MLSLSPTTLRRASIALETVVRAPLPALVNNQTPRNLANIPPAIRGLPLDLQVIELADMLADAQKQIRYLDCQCRNYFTDLQGARAALDAQEIEMDMWRMAGI